MANQQKVTATTLLNRIVSESLGMKLAGLTEILEITGETPT